MPPKRSLGKDELMDSSESDTLIERDALMGHTSRTRGRSNIGGMAVVGVLVVAVVLLALAQFNVLQVPGMSSAPRLQSDAWQAVFLSNGQVYFGKITNASDDTLTIDNVYYLQVVNRPLQRSIEGDTAAAPSQQELTLVKLGNEIHGPQDKIVVNRDHVLFTEELKEDGRVVDAIKRYLEDQAKEGN